ncbi:cryptochrome/photolyase family protein [Kribbella sp. NPDC049174]|uniref:cryptochrome/photolyase family protein n=1 Tax=Kribbella sp. NPDC049174 TaxID=3364112 RepID=UPI003710C24C
MQSVRSSAFTRFRLRPTHWPSAARAIARAGARPRATMTEFSAGCDSTALVARSRRTSRSTDQVTRRSPRRTVVMRILSGEGAGSVVESHPTPLGIGDDGRPRTTRWLFGDQLRPHFVDDTDDHVLMVESRRVFARRHFHRQQAHLVMSAMRHRAAELVDRVRASESRGRMSRSGLGRGPLIEPSALGPLLAPAVLARSPH